MGIRERVSWNGFSGLWSISELNCHYFRLRTAKGFREAGIVQKHFQWSSWTNCHQSQRKNRRSEDIGVCGQILSAQVWWNWWNWGRWSFFFLSVLKSSSNQLRICRNEISSDIHYTGQHQIQSLFGQHKNVMTISSDGSHWPNRTVNTLMANGDRDEGIEIHSSQFAFILHGPEFILEIPNQKYNVSNRGFPVN